MASKWFQNLKDRFVQPKSANEPDPAFAFLRNRFAEVSHRQIEVLAMLQATEMEADALKGVLAHDSR